MRFNIAGGEPALTDHLSKHIGMHIGTLLSDRHFGDQRFGSGDKPDPDTGCKQFGEAADIDHSTAFIERLDAGNRLTGAAQIAVWVVLQYKDVIFFGEAENRFPLFEGGGDTRRILEVGYHIEEFDIGLFPHRLLELFQIDPVRLHLDPDQVAVVGAEAVQTSNKRRVLAENSIPLIDQCLGGEVGALLCP